MKKCPYCGQEILAVAKKCKYCGEWLDEKVQKEPKAEVERHYAFKEETIVNENQNEPETESEPRKMFSKPFSFNGRINRKEYILSILIISFGGGILAWILRLLFPDIDEGMGLGFVFIMLYVLAAFYSIIVAMVKRCHDSGTPSWLILLMGPILIYVLMIVPRKKFDNEYGKYQEY